MTDHIVYEIKLGDQRKTLRYPNVTLAETVHGFVPGKPVKTSRVDYEVDQQTEPQAYTLVSSGKTILFSQELYNFVAMLNNKMISELVDEYKHGLALHSAALIKNNKSLLLPAKSGAGKTTLTAWLLTQGFDYASDETVLTSNDARMFAFPRPLNLNADVIPLIEQLGVTYGGEKLRSDLAHLAQPELFGAIRNSSPTNAAMAIFPQYQAGADLEFQALSSARASHALLGCLLNARNLPKHGLTMVSEFSRSIKSWSLKYSSFDQLGPVLDKINRTLR